MGKTATVIAGYFPESKKLDVACIDVHGNAVPTIIKIAQKIEIDFLFII